MNNFWSLVRFECKKVLGKKSSWLALSLALLVSAVCVGGTLFGAHYVEGEVFETHYEAMVKDREYARSLAGRVVNADLIMETAQAYAHVPTQGIYYDTEEYQTFARPYDAIYSLTRTVYNTESRRFNMEDYQKLTKEQAEQFYSLRHDRQVKLVEATHMSAKAQEKVLALDQQIQTPWIFSYTGGYTRFFVIINTIGIIAAFVMAVCIAPLFSGEYVSGTDQLLLASKYGKNKLIYAKLFTGFSFGAITSLVFTLLAYTLSLLLLGSDGANAPLQLYFTMSPYPLTMGETAAILGVCTFFACLMTTSITMLLSAIMKSPYYVIILISLLLVLPLFYSMSQTNLLLYNLYNLLPANMMTLSNVLGGIQYELEGLIIKPYVFMPLFSGAMCLLLTPLTYRSFKNHQIV